MDNTVTIRRIAEEQMLDTGGRVKQVVRIDFVVGDHGPFVERFDKADFNADAARAQLDAFARSLSGLMGR